MNLPYLNYDTESIPWNCGYNFADDRWCDVSNGSQLNGRLQNWDDDYDNHRLHWGFV